MYELHKCISVLEKMELEQEQKQKDMSVQQVSSLPHEASLFNPYLAAVLIEGKDGKTFCAGADIDLVSTFSHTDAHYMSELMTNTTNRLKLLKTISISCVDGYAIGGGAELLTATDLRCFSRTSKVKFVQGNHNVST